MGLTFFEPSYTNDVNYYQDWRYGSLVGVQVFEGIILVTFWIDIMCTFLHQFHDDSITLKQKFLKNKKLFANAVITTLYTADALNFYIRLPTTVVFRFSRPFRPSNILLFLPHS